MQSGFVMVNYLGQIKGKLTYVEGIYGQIFKLISNSALSSKTLEIWDLNYKLGLSNTIPPFRLHTLGENDNHYSIKVKKK